MTIMRFRWTRRKYQHARQIARLLSRFDELPLTVPAVVQRYWELWERYPQYQDPLLAPLRCRRRYDPDIPF
jgi:hypothetical protein